MTLRPLLRLGALPLLLACSGDGGGDDEGTGLEDSFGEVDGSWVYGGETLSFVGGVAYGNAFFHDDRAVVALTTWDDASCAGGDWLQQKDGYLLEVPFDAGSGVEEGMLQDCETVDGGYFCGGASYPDVQVDLDAEGTTRGDPVSGTLSILDADGGVEAEITFNVVYCGEE